MMPAYDALMKQGGVGQPTGMRATPAHHILEEKENPVTVEKKIVGSDWRNRAQAQADKLKGLAYDESVPMHMRQKYDAEAKQLLDRITAADIYHNQAANAEQEMLMSGEDDALAREELLAREKMPNPYQGLLNNQAPGVPKINPRGHR